MSSHLTFEKRFLLPSSCPIRRLPQLSTVGENHEHRTYFCKISGEKLSGRVGHENFLKKKVGKRSSCNAKDGQISDWRMSTVEVKGRKMKL